MKDSGSRFVARGSSGEQPNGLASRYTDGKVINRATASRAREECATRPRLRRGACAASDAGALVHHGKALDDVDRLHRTLPGACRARHSIRNAYATVLLPDRVPHVHVLALKARNHLYSSGRAHPVAPQAALADRRKRHDHCEQDYARDLASVFCQSSRHCLSFCLVLLATYTPARMSAPPHTPGAVSASPRNATANATPMTGVR